MTGSGAQPGPEESRGDGGDGGGGRTGARRRFAALAALPDEAIDLAEGALLIAAEEYPTLDVDAYVQRLEGMASRVRGYLEAGLVAERGADADEAALQALHRVLFEEEGLHGTRQAEFGDPRNSFLNEVLERKRGLPIILSVVYCEVARRAGLDAVGIGLPGRFIVQFRGRHLSVFVDPFERGTRLTPEECATMLSRVFNQSVELTPEHFLPASRKAILARILNNLKGEYLQAGELTRALSAVERILMLGATLDQVRDRGLILRRMGLLLLGVQEGRGGSRGRGAQPGQPGPSGPAPDLADLQAAQQLLSAAWFDLMLYAREGADRPDAQAVREAGQVLWRRLGRQN
jgi:regulator of sirC expression with transglutaminase-like and TPR domain